MTNDKQAALAVIQTINAVDGFDPTPLAVEYTDFNEKETRLRLPVMQQLAWFRLKYPEGRVATSVMPAKDCFVATARVYPHYTNPPEQYLAEATVSRGYLPDKPTISPREWAQTAAIGRALQYAGFGLQFSAAGDAFDSPAVDELGGIVWSGDSAPHQPQTLDGSIDTGEHAKPPVPPQPKPTEEDPLTKAKGMPCPIAKYSGKTLGEVLEQDQKAIVWVATKFSGDAEISAAAKLICDTAMQESA